MTSSPGFTAKLFDEPTLHEHQQIHITRTLLFAAAQNITEPEADETDFECVHFFSADDSGRVLAYLRMFDLEHVNDGNHRTIADAWTLGRVAVRQEVRRNGLGRKLLHAAIDWIRTNTSARQIVISAQAYLRDTYYGAAGFVARGEPYQEAGIKHIEMVLDL